MPNLLGRPHYELIEHYGFRETLIGRYATEAEAASQRELRLRIWTNMRVSHGTLIVRRVEF
jgi:hypothetical protein